MSTHDLSTLAGELRKQGLDARNLGQVGITIWEGRHGCYLSAEEVREMGARLAPREFQERLRRLVSETGPWAA